MGWPEGLLIDGTNTVADMKASTVSYIKNSIIAGSTTANFKSTDATFQTEMPTWFTTNGGRAYTENAEVKIADAFNVANPNPMPTQGSPVFTGGATPPSDGFFDAASNFVGAFGKVNWAEGWSSLIIATPTSVKEIKNTSIPDSYELSQNYPNPFNPSTIISFSLPKEGNVKLGVYNLLGQEVASLVDGFREAGSYNINWNASKLSSGIYIYRIESNSFSVTKKMALLK
jgi:hypothetical protein